jgi:hypothetical protein
VPNLRAFREILRAPRLRTSGPFGPLSAPEPRKLHTLLITFRSLHPGRR